jgi:hypothetical protein
VSPGWITEGGFPVHPIAVHKSHGEDWLPLLIELPDVETYQSLANVVGDNIVI